MNPTTRSSCSATMPMQLRCRRQRMKSSSSQGNSKLSASMARTSGMSRRIIQRIWTRTSCCLVDLHVGLLPCRPGKRGQVQFAGTARRVLRTNWTCPLFPLLVGWQFHCRPANRIPQRGPYISKNGRIRQYELLRRAPLLRSGNLASLRNVRQTGTVVSVLPDFPKNRVVSRRPIDLR